MITENPMDDHDIETTTTPPEEVNVDYYEEVGKRLSTDTRPLFVALTTAEWTDYAEKMSARFAEVVAEEEAEAERRKLVRDRIGGVKAEHQRLAELVATKREMRPVQCRSYGVLDTNEVITVRVDLGTVIERRAMLGEERERLLQVPLAFGPGVVADEPNGIDAGLPPEVDDVPIGETSP